MRGRRKKYLMKKNYKDKGTRGVQEIYLVKKGREK